MQLATTTAALDKLARDGRVRYVGVASEKRSPFAPTVPTLRENLPAMSPLESWSALFGPAALPDSIALPISAAARAAISSPEVVEKLAAQFISPLYMDKNELKAAMSAAGVAQLKLRLESGIAG